MIIARVIVAGVGEKNIEIAEGHPELAIENKIEAPEKWRRNADYGEGASRERDGLADDIRI